MLPLPDDMLKDMIITKQQEEIQALEIQVDVLQARIENKETLRIFETAYDKKNIIVEN